VADIEKMKAAKQAAAKAASKRFDRIFKPRTAAAAPAGAGSAAAASPADDIEYWNQQRAALGLSKLKS
jgi:hypothetical protein